jgi:4-amino-4-deoxy-L-arabinose transferase-like glycosyltransferase
MCMKKKSKRRKVKSKGFFYNVGAFFEENQRVIYALTVMLVVGILLRMLFFVGLNISDSPAYLAIILQLKEKLDGRLMKGLFGSRVLMILPPVFFVKIFGLSEMSLVSHSMICSLLLMPLVYMISRCFYDRETSLLAAFLTGIVPFNILWASWLMPDVLLEFYLSLAALSLFYGFKDRKRMSILFFLSGFTTGLAFLVKLTALLFLLVVVSICIYRFLRERRIDFRVGYFIPGFVIVILLQLMTFYLAGGNPFENLEGIRGFYEDYVFLSNLLIYPTILFGINGETLEFELEHFTGAFMFTDAPLYGLFGFFTVVSVLYLLFRKDESVTEVLIWLLVLALYLNFGTQSITGWKLIHKDARFLSILIPPSMILVSRFILDLYRRNLLGKIISSVFLLFIVASSLYISHKIWLSDSSTMFGFRSAYEFIKHKKGFYYIDPTTNNYLTTFNGGDLVIKFRRIELLDCENTPNVYVFDDNWSRMKDRSRGNKCLQNISKDWILEFDSYDHMPRDFVKRPRWRVRIWRTPGEK